MKETIFECAVCKKVKRYTTFAKGRPNVKRYRIGCDCGKYIYGFDKEKVVSEWNFFLAPVDKKLVIDEWVGQELF